MATYNKFQDFIQQFYLHTHDLDADTLKVYLSNEQPLATDTTKTDIAEITPEHGYPAGGMDILNAFSFAAGTGTLTATDAIFTADGGSFGPLKFAIVYNTEAADRLVCWWERPGDPVTILDTETLTVDFAAAVFTIG